MKICAIICEYNPFHNGHLLHIRESKRLSGADAVVCIMSGNFMQRGDAAIMDKFTRAKHAVMAGADAVIELPTPFATSNAELFAKGAIALLSSIPSVKTLSFGAENANKTAFKLAAKYINDEPKEVSQKLKEELQSGASYAKARANAFAGFVPFDLLTSSNNILGLEYTRAILEKDADIDILPIQRIGASYNEEKMQENFSSATAIRNAVENGQDVTANLPDYVAVDLPKHLQNQLEILEKYALLSRSTHEIAKVCDCREGLENAFKRVAATNAPLVQSLTSTRYTASRIRRIALQNLLNIDEQLIRQALQNPLYLRVLAIREHKEELLSALSESPYPLLARPRDATKLTGTAKRCYQIDKFAESVYRLLYPTNNKEIDIFV